MFYPSVLVIKAVFICLCSLLFLSSNICSQSHETQKLPEKSVNEVSSKGASPDAQLLPSLMAELLSKDEQTRKKAAKALGEMGQPAVEKVLYAVRHLASNIGRKRVATALCKFDDPAAVDILKRSIKEEDLPVVAGAYSCYIAKAVPGSEDQGKVIKVLIKAFYEYSDSSMARAFLESGDPELARAAQTWSYYQTRLSDSSNAEEFMALYFEAKEAGLNLSEDAGKTIAKMSPKVVEDLAGMVNQPERAVRFRAQAAGILENAIEEDRRIIDSKKVKEELLKAVCDPNQAIWTIANQMLSRFGGNWHSKKPCR